MTATESKVMAVRRLDAHAEGFVNADGAPRVTLCLGAGNAKTKHSYSLDEARALIVVLEMAVAEASDAEWQAVTP